MGSGQLSVYVCMKFMLAEDPRAVSRDGTRIGTGVRFLKTLRQSRFSSVPEGMGYPEKS